MIVTKVEGTPSQVDSAATWLRQTLKPAMTDGADLGAAGRSIASTEWEGTDASAYSAHAKKVVEASDEHAERVGCAATAFEDFSGRLTQMRSTMSGLRTRATGGGLTVTSEGIEAPPIVPPTVVLPGSQEEADHLAKVAEVDLYDELAGEATTAWTEYDAWIQANLVPAVTDAEEKTTVDRLQDEVESVYPGLLSGLATGLAAQGLSQLAEGYKGQAREFRRKSRVSGDPRVRGQADTPAGKSKLDDLMRRTTGLGKFMGPLGVVIELGMGYQQYRETGDWKRAALTTGASLAVAGGVALYVATAPVSVPATLVVIGGAALATGVSWGVGKIYDNWDDITDWTGDRWDDTKDLAGDAWDGAKDLAGDAKDKVGDAWDKVTPW